VMTRVIAVVTGTVTRAIATTPVIAASLEATMANTTAAMAAPGTLPHVTPAVDCILREAGRWMKP
jgi:hypothetical protein